MTNICVITTYNNKSIPLYPGVSWSILQSSPDKNTLLGDSQDRLTRSLIGLSPRENFIPIGRWWCGSTYACSGYFSASNYLVLNILWESQLSLQWQFLLAVDVIIYFYIFHLVTNLIFDLDAGHKKYYKKT